MAQDFNFGNVNWSGCPGASNPTFQGESAYVADFRNGQLFKFGNGGGAATSGNVLASLSQTLGQPTFGKDGSLYATFSATTGNFTTGSDRAARSRHGTASCAPSRRTSRARTASRSIR